MIYMQIIIVEEIGYYCLPPFLEEKDAGEGTCEDV